MKLETIMENVIKTASGSIATQKLDNMITAAMKRFEVDMKHFDKVKADVIDDYHDGDISRVTQQDIAEIIDAGGYAEE